MQRQRDWRARLVNWAHGIRGSPYVWSETDCAALARTALALQFGQDLFPFLPTWPTREAALKVWAALDGGVVGLLLQAGAQPLGPRHRGRWPMGSILLMAENVGPLPALSVYVHPNVVQSDPEHGVTWGDPVATAKEVQSAWIIENAEVVN